MKLQFFLAFFCFLFLVAAATPSLAQQLQPEQARAAAVTAQSEKKLYGEVDLLRMTCLQSGIKLKTRTLPSQVEDVAYGSPAFYAGVVRGDTIFSASVGTDRMKLLIDRIGHRYSAEVITGGKYIPERALDAKTDSNRLSTAGNTDLSPQAPRLQGGATLPLAQCLSLDINACPKPLDPMKFKQWQAYYDESKSPELEPAWQKWHERLEGYLRQCWLGMHCPYSGHATEHVIISNTGGVDDVSTIWTDNDGIDQYAKQLANSIQRNELLRFPQGSKLQLIHFDLRCYNPISPKDNSQFKRNLQVHTYR